MEKNKFNKYMTVELGGVITQIVEKATPGDHVVKVMEVFFPEYEEWTPEQSEAWIKKNNKRMKAICKFLNRKNL